MIKNKCSQSEVISTVLLILITVASVIILVSYVIPFIKDKLSESDCIKFMDKIEIKENLKYTCYNRVGKNFRAQVYIGDILNGIKNFVITIESAESKKFDVNDKAQPDADGLCMFSADGTCSPELISFPEAGGQKTYLMNEIEQKPSSIGIYLVLKNGKICSSVKKLNFVEACED